MINASHLKLWRLFLVGMLLSFMSSAWAGLSVYTDGTTSPPNPAANQRTIDFDTTTLASEQTAGKITYSSSSGAATCVMFVICTSGGSVSYTSSSSLTGFSSNVMSLTSGTTANSTSVTVNFATHTPYVGFLWGAQFVSTTSQQVNITLADNSVVTLKNCTTVLSNQCMGAYVDTNWLTNLLNTLFGWLLGDSVDYYSTYVQYQPSNGLKIKSIQFVSNKCTACGFLSADTSQDFKVDKLTYVDGTVAPDHVEITTSGTTGSSGVNTTYTIKACGNAACTLPYINGVTGTLGLSGAGLTATYPSGSTFTIAAGPTNTTTIQASVSPTGTATVALSAISPAPTNGTKFFCGIGVAAASGNACTMSVLGLHHMEVTTPSASGTALSSVTYTIKACADAACSTTYTGGVTGSIGFAGVTMGTPVTGSSAFTISSGSASTTVAATPATTGTMTASLSGVSPAATATPAVYCGIGVAAASGNSCGYTVGATLHHLELTTASSSNVTCQPITYTVKACSNAACSSLYTGGVTGTVAVAGVSVNYLDPVGSIIPTGAFTIGAGSSQTTVSVHAVSVGTATATVVSVPVATTYCGMGSAAASGASCALSSVSSILQMSVPNFSSGSQQTVTVSSVKSSSDSTVCLNNFTSVTRALTMKCTYTNPTTGTLPVRVGGSALNSGGSNAAACDGTGKLLNLAFNASGVATTTVDYADVGTMGMTLAYVGSALTNDLNLNLTGSLSFTSVPASFGLVLPSTSQVAGTNFSATLTALNSAGVATPNFGKETVGTTDLVRISWAKTEPTGVGAVTGSFSGKGTSAGNPISSSSFTNGVVNLSDLNWTEVGKGTLSVSLVGTSYLGVVTSIVDSTLLSTRTLTFVPHHFDQVLTQPCSTFTYSGQPFSIMLTAKNALGQTTANYDGTANTTNNQAKSFSLSGIGVNTGSLTNATGLSASNFGAGIATITSSPVFSFTNKLTSPTTVPLRITDGSGVTSALGTETFLVVRSGRLKVSNAFAADNKSSLDIPVQTQYWNGKTWAVNSMDSCTKIPVASVVRSNYLDYKGASTAAWTTTPATKSTVNGVPMAVVMSSGNGTLTLGAPSPASVGSVDFAFNLGSGAQDSSCLGSHPASTGANATWLRALNGGANACSGVTTYDRDPGARATFGVYKPESKKAVFSRDVY